jgi:putative transposase
VSGAPRVQRKSAGHLLASVEDRFRFIDHHRQHFEVRILCRVLDVSVSGYYAWNKRPMSSREREDGELREKIVAVFHTHRGVYGSPRIHATLQAEGIRIGRKRVVRLMQQIGLSAHCRTHRVGTTKANPRHQVAENVLDRQFQAEQPNQKGAADVTYVGTASGWLYLAVVLDLFSRRVVGWAMAATPDETLVEQALGMALAHRQPAAGLLHHSDRGCQYTREAYQTFLKEHALQVSMSRKGNWWDNAVVERFFGTLKRECTSRERFQTHGEARTALFEYIETFYNRVRKHSTLGYLSPVQFELVKE